MNDTKDGMNNYWRNIFLKVFLVGALSLSIADGRMGWDIGTSILSLIYHTFTLSNTNALDVCYNWRINGCYVYVYYIVFPANIK